MKSRLSYVQVIALGYAIIIAVGTLLLMLPFSSVSGESASFSDAFFTATSASCVTGLVQVDTGSYWSFFGQVVIIILIQIGGLGFVTIATLFMMAMKKRIGIRSRELMIESINSSNIGGILRLTKKILLGTLIIEGIGALILSVRFAFDFPIGKAIWFGIFHSISAFCNAGFDLMGVIEPYSSFMHYSSDLTVTVTIMLLIVIGGIGFLVWDDILKNGIRFKKYSFHTKLVLCTTAILIFGGALFMFIFECNASNKQLSLGDQIIASFFASISARTAGMNITDTAAFSEAGRLVNVFLFFIGGSSGSTAGGIKTTTFAVLLIHAFSSMRGKSYPSALDRRISDGAVKKAITIFFTNLSLALIGGAVIMSLQPSLGMSDVLFETFSAMGTVGMTTGITRELCTVSKYIIITLMYLGRVGSISFAAAMMQKKAPPNISVPTEEIIIG
ncbi:MAG: Trk family potassium uptake protein [Clostridia bacterium]|nr:Trk family potassium uptake protein [Clostridia bacterium]